MNQVVFRNRTILKWSLNLVVLLCALYSCKTNKPAPSYINPAFGEYISSYTAGVISSSSTIRVVLSREVATAEQLGKESAQKVFSFSPALDGKTVWVDARTLEFTPEKRLTQGTVYQATFFLSNVSEVPEEFEMFQFSFQVIPQNFELSIDNVLPYEKTELKRQKIEGTLVTADFVEAADLEKTMTAEQSAKKLAISWVHTGEGKTHHFTVEDVVRADAAGKVHLKVDGNSIGVDRTLEEDVEIPSLGDFKLVSAKVVQTPNQVVVLQFSDPLKEKQELQGLITIPGVSGLEFTIQDNQIMIYPAEKQSGTKTIRIEAGVRNILDYRMSDVTTADVVFEQVAPAVRFTGNGSILPGTDGLVLPFEAVNLNAVDITIFKIYENNILQFFQVNNYEGNSELYRVGKKLVKKTIQLKSTGVTDVARWNRYTLNLAEFIQAEPGAIYQVKIGFKKSYSAYTCADVAEEIDESQFETEDDEYEQNYSDGYYEDDYYYYDDYDWDQRDNPCTSSYYTSNRMIKKNILASDLGLTTKRGDDGKTLVFVTDLKTTAPLSGIQVELYNFQQQLLGTATTNADGKAELSTKEAPFVMIARNGAQRGYLRLGDGESLSLSTFDVSGEQVDKGLKGILYGDRGVWRPGDSLYLTFVLEDRLKQFPSNHPVVFELQNPQGQVTSRMVKSGAENGFYAFPTATSPDAPTGNWIGRVKAGGLNLSQVLKIETVKPNRLKINLNFGKERFTEADVSGRLEVKWLHGAPGRRLKSQFELLLVPTPTVFPNYKEYTFDDIARSYTPEAKPVFDGFTDDDGNAIVDVNLDPGVSPPGFLNAVFRGKVFEESGNFSIDRFSLPYYPYSSYIGMKTPEGEKYSGILYFDKPHQINLVTLDQDGKPVSRSNVELSLFKLNWQWWWDNSTDGIANYVEGAYSKLVKKASVSTQNGKGTYNLQLKASENSYGRYYLRACDPESGHCTGEIVYIDEPGWYSRSRSGESGAPNILAFTTDKTTYSIGEKVNVTIPTNDQGRALISIENGTRVVQTYWVETKAGETKFSFDATSEMTPNVYVNVSLLQPHSQTLNDLPIRLYGVTGITVEDPGTHLEPVIAMPDVLEPGEEVAITISEKSKRKMTYTVAVVDEGLLDITRFKTPDLWSRFYSREALGVRTWDLYDEVIGAFGSKLERILTIGGDAEGAAKEDDPRANRFKPVVKYFGPFTLDGGTKTHKFIMPQYIGSVKTMVVAGYEGAYGKAEKATPVRKPLMVLATLPRVLGPEEKLRLPVTLFTQEKGIRNVKVQVKVKGPVSISGETTKTVSIPASGDLTVDFDVSVRSEVGIANFEVTATSGKFTATDAIEIEVRNPNVAVTKVSDALLEAGKQWKAEVEPFGVAGTNIATIEVSNMPPVNLDARLRYLIQYPYGCIEQTTSSVLPQLFLADVKALTENEKVNIQRNVTMGIERLKSFVVRDGGFGYWPGAEQSDNWGTTYAGHFLIEAGAKGYYVPDDMTKRWKKFQKARAEEWRRDTRYYNNDLLQAYRLYTLALAGVPEIGAMNRLREDTRLSLTGAWMLAAAYAKAGQPEAARKIIAKLGTDIKPYRELGYSYGSEYRDKALILETLILLNDKARAFDLVKELSKALSDPYYWMSTQETAMCLKAIGSFSGMDKRGDFKFAYTLNGKTIRVVSQQPVFQVPVPVLDLRKQIVSLENQGGGALFARVITEGIPAQGQEEDAANNLAISVRYTNMKGAPVDITRIEQGSQLIAEVAVTHKGTRSYYENLALAQVFPSGFEINNLRLTDDNEFLKSGVYNYQDIRDDRVYTYFGLSANETRTFKVILTASYSGTFYFPAVSCEAMYDHSIYARQKGFVVEITKAGVQ